MQQPSSASDDIARGKGGSQHTITEADIEEEQASPPPTPMYAIAARHTPELCLCS